MSLRRAAALHFNDGQSRVGLYDEIDLFAALSPIVKLALSGGRSVGEMCADRGFNEPATEFAVRTRLLRADAGGHRHQGCVEYFQLWARAAAARRIARVLRQSADH